MGSYNDRVCIATGKKGNIQKFGPVSSAFIVYDDFMQYKSGIYTGPAQGAKELGGHAIKIMGWGTRKSDGLGYWIVANSWGSDWGEGGFFKIMHHSGTMMDHGVSAGEISESSQYGPVSPSKTMMAASTAVFV